MIPPEQEVDFELTVTIRYTARIHAANLPQARERLSAVRNWLGRKWFLPRVADRNLREHWIDLHE